MPAQDFVQLIQTEPLAGVTIVSVDGAAIAASKSAIARESDSMLRGRYVAILAEGQGIQSQTGMQTHYPTVN